MKRILVLIVFVTLICSCVSKSKYVALEEELQTKQDEIEELQSEISILQENNDDLESDITDLENTIEELEDIIYRAKQEVQDADFQITFDNTFGASLAISSALFILNEHW